MTTRSDECGGGGKEEDDEQKQQHQIGVEEASWKDIAFEDIELGRQIGGGGVGIVYQGWYEGEAVALKTLFDPRVDEALQEDFMNELLVMSRLHHPNIISIIGACLRPPHLFFVMELCEQSLFDLLQGKSPCNPLPLAQQVQIAMDVARAMDYLHHTCKPAIIHRDLKTHNLLLSADGSVKVCDFGLVKTRNTTAGTPNYMAPELLDNRAFNKSVDVYAYGIVLYEIMTSEVFLEGYDLVDIKRKVIGGQRPRPPTIDCPEGLQRLMQRCWSKEPSDRPAFDEIIEILEEVMQNLPSKSSLQELEGCEDALDDLMGKKVKTY